MFEFQICQINKCSIILFPIKTDISRVFRTSASAYCLTALNGFNGLLGGLQKRKKKRGLPDESGERIRLPRK